MTTSQRRWLQAGLAVLFLFLYVGGLFGVYSREGGGVFVCLAAALALGAVIGRWWALVVAFIPVLVTLPIDHPEGSVAAAWLPGALFVFLPVVAVGIGLGVLGRRYLFPRGDADDGSANSSRVRTS